jgi:hypothetical protein
VGAGGSIIGLIIDADGDLLDDEVLGPADEES